MSMEEREMNKQFVAHIPARTIKGQSKVFTYPAREEEYACDDAGQWTGTIAGQTIKMNKADVIDACRDATNWQEIRALYFPMYGFHADGPSDNSPAHKCDM
jgi:hypothetical protein